MSETGGIDWLVVGGAAMWAILVAVIGQVLTVIDEWYFSLKKPGWKPPDWTFGVIWTTIFILGSIALYRGWTLAPDAASQWLLAGLFVVNGVLNIAWNILFFSWKRPDWALVETYFLIASVLTPIFYLMQIDTLAALLLIPYALWVSVACYLTYEIVQLNGPFEGVQNN